MFAELAGAAHAEREPKRKPPATQVEHNDSARMVGGIVLGVTGSIALGIAGGHVGISLGGCQGEFSCNGLLLGGYAGYILGAGTGVALAWNMGDSQSSYSSALLGALAGGGLGAGTLLVTQSGFGLWCALGLPVIGATIGASKSHRHSS